MRLRIDARASRPLVRVSLVLWLAISLAIVPQVARAADQTGPEGVPVSDAEIPRAVEILKKDPNLTAEQTIKTLRWKHQNTRAKRSSGGFKWLANFIGWINQSLRMLVWVAAALLIGLLFLYFFRLVGRHRRQRPRDGFVAPTHVRDLDIRPETLPSDIGAAARRLWDDGEQRAALALLYRGLLSRLAHVHRVPIRDSSTEGDCLALAARHLTQRKRDYASSLVKVWQRAVYGREDVQTPTVYTLCDGFAAALDARDPMDAGGVA